MTRPGLPTLATLAAVALLAAVPAQADPPPHAKAWGHKSRQAEPVYYDRHYYYGDRAYGDHHHRRDVDFDDVRYYSDRHRHDRDCGHYDARRVYVVERLPYGHRHIDYRGYRYFYDRRGQWYEPYGAAYVRIAPPAGLVIDARGIAMVASVPIVRW